MSNYKSQPGKEKVLNFYNNTLKENNLAGSGHYINTPFGETFLLKTGLEEGIPLCFIHGSSSNTSMWMEEIKELKENHPIIALDIPGEVGNSSEERFSVDSNDFSNWLKAVFDELKHDKVILIGNSYGGWGALNFAIEFPERVEKLVLIASSGLTNIKPSFLLKAILYTMQGKAGAEKLNKLVFSNDEIPKEALDAMDLIMSNFNPRVNNLRVYKDDELSKLTMPVMYIAGEDDVTVNTKKSAKRLTKLLMKPTITLIKNHGHVIHGSSKEIDDFVKRK